MALFSQKSLYAVEALYLIYTHKEEQVRVKDLAAMMQVSAAFLEQILSELKKAQLLKSQRGAKGGFALNKEAKEIAIYDIVESVEPKSLLVKGRGGMVLEAFWADVSGALKKSLDLKLSELSEHYIPLSYQI